MNIQDKMRARLAEHQPKAAKWYDIRALDESKAVVRIYDEIGYWGITADQFASDLAALDVADIEVQINSPGGSVFDGIAIYNTLRTHPARITTRVDGIAASAASFIVQAGDHRVMLSAAQMMIHEAWGAAIGPADELREFADLLDKQNDVLAGIYAQRSGKPAAEFRELMRSDLYLTDQEAVDLGLADEVIDPGEDSKNLAIPPLNKGGIVPAASDTTPPIVANTALVDIDAELLALKAKRTSAA